MESFLPEIIILLLTIVFGGIGYALKRIFEKIDLMSIDIADIKPKIDILWKDKYASSMSPRQLNETGIDILNISGIKEIINAKKDSLLVEIKKTHPNNAYDAEQAIMFVVNKLPEDYPDIISQLKNGAFSVGQNIDVLLLVGGIYLRNMIFPELGFSLTDLDQIKSA